MGRAVAEELGRNGCRVVVVARGQQRLDETVEAIRREGGQAVAVSADITRLESFPLIVEQAKAAFDLPDIAIYAPVAPPSGSFEEFDDEDLDRAYAYVVKGFAHFVRAVAPNLNSKNWARLITIRPSPAKSPTRPSLLNFEYDLSVTFLNWKDLCEGLGGYFGL